MSFKLTTHDNCRKLAARAFKAHNGSGSALSAAGLGLTEKKMRLMLHTDYALRVLIHVAIVDGKSFRFRLLSLSP